LEVEIEKEVDRVQQNNRHTLAVLDKVKEKFQKTILNSKTLSYLTSSGQVELAAYGSSVNGLFEEGESDLDLTLKIKSDFALNHKDFLRDVGLVLKGE
jgi:hypothetical protein